jgi:RimJ/RimL family protein N-acetyltransferase
MFPEITRDDVFRLETRRLWLRWPRANDAQGVARIAARKEVADMTANIPHPYPAGAADAWIIDARSGNSGGGQISLLATLNRGARDVVGFVSARFEPDGTVVLGYAFAPEHWGKGYATESLQPVLDAVFTLTQVEAATAQARVTNPASQRVLRKCGFSYETSGLVEMKARGGLFPVDRFRLDRKVWRSLKGWGEPRFRSREVEAPPGVEVAACL